MKYRINDSVTFGAWLASLQNTKSKANLLLHESSALDPAGALPRPRSPYNLIGADHVCPPHIFFWCDAASAHRRRYVSGLLDNSLTNQLAVGQVADWSTRGLDNSRTGQFVDWSNSPKCSTQKFAVNFQTRCDIYDELTSLRIVQSVTYPVNELISPQLDLPQVGLSANCPVTRERMSTNWRVECFIYRSSSSRCSARNYRRLTTSRAQWTHTHTHTVAGHHSGSVPVSRTLSVTVSLMLSSFCFRESPPSITAPATITQPVSRHMRSQKHSRINSIPHRL